MEELGQLLLADVRMEGGIRFIDITEEEDADEPAVSKSVKSLASVRRVPLHQIALEVGLQDYWDSLVVTGQRRLFPEFPVTGKRTREMSRLLGRAFGHWSALPTLLLSSILSATFSWTDAGNDDGLPLDDVKTVIEALHLPGFPGVPARSGPFVPLAIIGIEQPAEAYV